MSIADLMSVLMLIFLLIAILYIQFYSEVFEEREAQADLAAQSVSAWMVYQEEIYESLTKELDPHLEAWDAEIEKESLTVRFKSPRVLFERGRAEISPRFEKILQDFWPRYISVLHRKRWREHIEEIRIEGHTSSEWEGASGIVEAYFENMRLSQDRTRAVMEFCLSLGAMRTFRAWLLEKVTANGLSSSRLLTDAAGREDSESSRRVEFRVIPQIIFGVRESDAGGEALSLKSWRAREDSNP